MASSPSLDAPPPQPPDVTSQQGGGGSSPFSGIGSMLQKKQDDQQGPANPRGSLITMKDAISKVLDQMSKMEPNFSPYADRINSLLDAGVGAVVSGGPPGSQSQQSQVMSPSQRPGDNSAQAPGAGFPG
jgi:hypothetical protein